VLPRHGAAAGNSPRYMTAVAATREPQCRATLWGVIEDFDALAGTPATREALERLRAATLTSNGPMERHCLRCRHIAAEIGRRRGWAIDGELLTVAAILHDIGLYPAASRGGVYTADGAALAREILAQAGWEAARIERCAVAIDCHHDVRPQLSKGAEVEALRLADRVEITGGLLTAGLDRRWLAALARAVPRRGLVGELVREIGRALRERPTTMARIFLRPSR
jgi:HD domain-containing protein